MKIPKKTKFRKYHKINVKNKIEVKKTKLSYGVYGVKALENGYLRMAQMKRIKEDIVKKLKGKTNIYFNFYPIFGLTNKGTARMGSGKGDIDDWYVPVKRGKILIEFVNCLIPKGEIQKMLKTNSLKWPIEVILTTVKKNLDENIKK
uniref:Ribosomal protein L16 n=1 Tax=Cavenderia fasciculata TaxID=261658 RepID=B2XX97_CACFS|nr:ribosomal protein L16 [Cavenderia fasciculata]ABX45219.1 ribosomal protein L16 [Cavenderia fasciculata]